MKHLVRSIAKKSHKVSTLYGVKVKRFNEDNNTEVDLKDFCETNLAYLLDDNNFELSVDGFDSDSSIDGYLQVDNSQIRLENDLGFKWDDIKDYFIPFLMQLDKVCGDRILIGDDKSIFVHLRTLHKTRIWYKVYFNDLVNDKLVSYWPNNNLLNNNVLDQIHIELI